MRPHSTYRLQLHAGFPFRAAEELVPYLESLGIGAAYLSPVLLARPGSTHGYDICDHGRLNPELGEDGDFRRLATALHGRGLGCIVDFVPNHMGADPASNPWWWDVLENGPSSPYAAFFDIDWNPLKPDLKGKVLLPVLGDQYGRVLARGELRLELLDGALVLRYYDHIFPINPRTAPLALAPDEGAPLPFEPGGAEEMEFLSILTALRNLPVYIETDPERIRERQREKEVARRRLAALLESSAAVSAYVAGRIAAWNETPGPSATFDRLHALLEGQAYRLAFWKTAGHEINYRRFFDINGLLGVRMENPEAFAATHGLLASLFSEGLVDGVRLDHVDGLLDPAGYLRSLRALLGENAYIVVEKILSHDEGLRRDWPVQGTTGYEWLNDINGLMVDPKGARRLDALYRRYTSWNGGFEEEFRECKRLILSTTLGGEHNVVANLLDRLSEIDRNSRDFTLESLRDAVAEVIAAFPVYRTYGDAQGFSAADRKAIDFALGSAARANPALDASIFRFLRVVMLPFEEPAADAPGARIPRERRIEFSGKFQQLTAPVQAKGVEDTAFYRRAPLLSLNEVGGEPGARGLDSARFHARALARSAPFPLGMIATATHDTKRGEDARARLDALTEAAGEWRGVFAQLSVLSAGAARARARTNRGSGAISREDESHFYQTLAGCWPLAADGAPLEADRALRDRLLAYAVKAAREAKVHTSWINPDPDYEGNLEAFLDFLLLGEGRARFHAIFLPFIRELAPRGALRSLAQTALKCGLPGVPDIYQGTERWDFSLVDPDNRRPVDFGARRDALRGMEARIDPAGSHSGRREWAESLLDRWGDGEIKQYVLARALRWRAAHADLFLAGTYRPLPPAGARDAEWIAFAREHEGGGSDPETLIVFTRVRGPARSGPRPAWEPIGAHGKALPLPEEWGGKAWINLFTGTRFVAAMGPKGPELDTDALAVDFPAAWLVPQG